MLNGKGEFILIYRGDLQIISTINIGTKLTVCEYLVYEMGI